MKADAHKKKQGGAQGYAAGVQPDVMNDAQKRRLQSGAKKIVGTDSVPSPVSVVCVAPILAKALTT
jgi:phosphoribosylpyrophosphate synthetase